MVYLLDPLIATGGTAIAAVHMITDWGIPGPHRLSPPHHRTIRSDFTLSATKIKLLSILASEAGLRNVEKEFPELEVPVYFRYHLLRTLISETSL